MSISINPMKEYIYDNTNKDIKSTIGFVNDFAGLNSALIGIMQNKEFGNIAQAFLDKIYKNQANKNIIKNLANNEFLTGAAKSFAKVSAYAVIIISALDAITYKKNEDYDALAATIGILTLNTVALFVTSGTPLIVFVSLSSIVYGLVMLKLEDSAFESYLKRSLFYKNNIYLESKDKKINGFPAKYLLETTNRKEELKAINSEGFTSAKKITNFIGENYKTNELYFDTALKNELSFLETAIYGITLQKVDYRITNRRTVIAGIERGFNVEHAVGIPKSLYEDDSFKLFFVPYEGAEYKELIGDLIQQGDNYIFNLFPDEAPYYQDRQFGQSAHSAKFKVYVIVLSSLVNAKYEIALDRGVSENYIMKINDIEQISFTPEDKQFIEGKMK
ncbi:hypothetical protein [Halarcobacter anaerophilus]|uniref:hypothetical protein n=1 Tax=Halarcobacter anaerophilus TaxID=877500 RepID=UPI0005C801B1|nr:hypothetical protein [Halarcobacter anaerophilus]